MAERPLPNWDVAEIRRRLGLVANFATVAEADYGHPRVRVRLTPEGAEKELVSDWLPWVTARAQNDRTWHPPEVGEQVFVVAPYGDLNQGCVLGAVFAQDAKARQAPADRPTVDRTEYADGTVEEYDRDANHWLLDMTANGGTMEIKTGSTQVLIKPDSIALRADRIDENDDR